MSDHVTNRIRQFTAAVGQWIGALVRGGLASLLDLSPGRWRCLSVQTCGEVVLSNEFLPGARALRVEGRIPWHCPWPEFMPRLSAVVLDEDNRTLLPDPVLTENHHQRNLRVTVTLPTEQLKTERMFRLCILNRENGRVLGCVPFFRLDRRALLDEIAPVCFETRAKHRGKVISTTRLHDRIDGLDCRVDLKLANQEHEAIFETVSLNARLALFKSGQTEVASWNARVKFVGGTFQWTAALPWPDLGPSGDYQLSLLLEDQPKAASTFSLQPYEQAYATTLKQVCEGARLISERYLATDHRGRTAPASVVAEDFQALAAELVLYLGQPDPLFNEYALPLRCVLKNGGGEEMAVEAQADAILRPGNNPIRFLFSFRREMFQSASDRCSLEVSLRESSLTCFEFTHQTRKQIIAERTQTILDSLKISGLELAVTREGESQVTDVAFVTDAFLTPRFQVRAEGFDEDVSEVVWPLTVHLLHQPSRQLIERRLNLRTRAGGNLYRRIKLGVPGKDAASVPGDYTLSLHSGRRMLAERPFRVLAEEEIKPFCQEQVLRNLRVDGSELLVECSGETYPSTEVPCLSRGINLRVSLASEGFSAALPRWAVPVELRLSSDAIDPVMVGATDVPLSPDLAHLDLPLTVADTFLAKSPGSYSLELHVAGRTLASYPFRLLSVAELCETVTVEPLSITATTRNSDRQTAVDDLNPELHEFIHIAFGTRPGSAGHPLAAPARVEIAAGDRVLFQSPFEVPLDAPLSLTRLRPLPVEALWQKAGQTSRQLTVRIRIGNRIRASSALRIGRRNRVTTVEGALAVAPEQMGNVEAEYAAILTNLGMNPATAGGR